MSKQMASANRTITTLLLREAVILVRKHFPEIKIRNSYAYHYSGSDFWEFHGPDRFYWHGHAYNAYEARYNGWMAWLKSKGIED
jgi:hypothetical protein